jgi:hypothetical protein
MIPLCNQGKNHWTWLPSQESCYRTSHLDFHLDSTPWTILFVFLICYVVVTAYTSKSCWTIKTHVSLESTAYKKCSMKFNPCAKTKPTNCSHVCETLDWHCSKNFTCTTQYSLSQSSGARKMTPAETPCLVGSNVSTTYQTHTPVSTVPFVITHLLYSFQRLYKSSKHSRY